MATLFNIKAGYHGILPFPQALDLQHEKSELVITGADDDQLLLLQHNHVYTLGRRGSNEDILIDEEGLYQRGIEIFNTDRGGEVTYHGPGQLVVYPIINLKRCGLGPLQYLRKIEEVIVNVLRRGGLNPETKGLPTGVWIGKSKIASIGVKIRKSTTFHGFALNVTTDLTYFDHIVACGIPNACSTSVAEEVNKNPNFMEITNMTAMEFANVFGYSLNWEKGLEPK
ncbi:MAG: hypothetical protein BZY65_02745 [SAR202 cluster bacterium Ae2-Chloro-G2]|nr:MAG: hypothetical protein BZY65_02745 [SAR202 cluster bacterium Ae2-Chloro-G2]